MAPQFSAIDHLIMYSASFVCTVNTVCLGEHHHSSVVINLPCNFSRTVRIDQSRGCHDAGWGEMRTTESPSHVSIAEWAVATVYVPLTNSISDCFFVVWERQ